MSQGSTAEHLILTAGHAARLLRYLAKGCPGMFAGYVGELGKVLGEKEGRGGGEVVEVALRALAGLAKEGKEVTLDK